MRYEERIRSAHRAERRNEQEAQRDRTHGSHTANVQDQLHLADCRESGCVAHHGRVDTKTEDEDPEAVRRGKKGGRSEEHTSELQSRGHLVCRLLLEKKNEKQMK